MSSAGSRAQEQQAGRGGARTGARVQEHVEPDAEHGEEQRELPPHRRRRLRRLRQEPARDIEAGPAAAQALPHARPAGAARGMAQHMAQVLPEQKAPGGYPAALRPRDSVYCPRVRAAAEAAALPRVAAAAAAATALDMLPTRTRHWSAKSGRRELRIDLLRMMYPAPRILWTGRTAARRGCLLAARRLRAAPALARRGCGGELRRKRARH